MPPPEGVNPGNFEANDSNTGGVGREVSYHQLEPQGPSRPAPNSFVALNPSKGRPKDAFPKHDVGSWSWRATLHVDLGAHCLLGRDVT
jgi:hypothetical protein